ncbi:PQQ-binding-like beta-propeller repeat protein [Chondromyces crocatus]|nr:PQQ-binding-like beta-propeller repeat protein [Chondromyces crocatus]
MLDDHASAPPRPVPPRSTAGRELTLAARERSAAPAPSRKDAVPRAAWALLAFAGGVSGCGTTSGTSTVTTTPVPHVEITTPDPATQAVKGRDEEVEGPLPLLDATTERRGRRTVTPLARPSRSTPKARTVTLRSSLKLPLKTRWTARVGKTTFRTTMALVEDAVVIGTHGDTLDGTFETTDGVYVLDAKTGRQRKLLFTPGRGDHDVGGIAVDGNRLFFTTDNGQVIATTLEGKSLWQAHLRGKVRPAPALAHLNGDKQLDVVVGDEEGQLSALNGATGEPLWRAQTGKNEYGARGFVGAAAIVDVDGDGRDDVIAGARDGVLTAYRGRDGEVLWQTVSASGMHASPQIVDIDGDGAPEVLAAWSYGVVALLDVRTGHQRWAEVLEQDGGGIEGLFASPVPLPAAEGPGVLIAPTAWWGDDDGILGVGSVAPEFRAAERRVSGSPVVIDLDGDGELEAIVGTEAGKVVALHADGGRAELASLPGGVEASPMLADVDGDGTYEVLVAANDGVLRCFETGATAKPVIARFRGESPHNRGDLGAVPLRWARSSTFQPR